MASEVEVVVHDSDSVAANSESTPKPNRLDPSETKKWQLKYGFRNEVDLVYEKYPRPQKPRLPDSHTDKKDWRFVSYPGSTAELFGNERVVSQLQSLEKGEMNTASNYIISGAPGTGKQSCLRLLKQILMARTPDGKRTQFLLFNAKTISEKDLVSKIELAARRVDPDKVVLFLVIENLEVVPIATQQHQLLPMISAINTTNVYCIVLIRPDANKLPDQLKQHAIRFHLHALQPLDVRGKILWICIQQRVGYTREGIEELLARCEFRLLRCITVLQQIFVANEYLSLPNVRKTLVVPDSENLSPNGLNGPTPPPYPLSILKMNEPLRRCKLCTLLPVCAHVTMETLYDRVFRTRERYPTRSDDKSTHMYSTHHVNSGKPNSTLTNTSHAPVPLCYSYVKRGICSNIQSIGRCRYAHPRQIHTIDTTVIVKRCKPHTLPLPCIHCTRLMNLKQTLQLEIVEQDKRDKDIKRLLNQLREKETERYIFVRDHAKTMKWGSAKREYEATLHAMDTKVQQFQCEMDKQKHMHHMRALEIEQMREDVRRGRTKGMGKGQGKLLQSELIEVPSPSRQR